MAKTAEEMQDTPAAPPAGGEMKSGQVDAMLDLFVALHARLAKGELSAERRRAMEAEADELAGKLVRALALPAPEPEDGAALGRTKGAVDEGSYYSIFKEFHELDQERRKGEAPGAERWERLAERCNVQCRVDNPLELRIAGPWLLRLRLIQGQSYLFASVQRYRARQSDEQLENYHKGIRLLQKLLRVKPEELGPMPKPVNEENNTYYYNAGVSDWDPGENKIWRSTHGMVEAVLTDFCPWGVGTYLLLREIKLSQYIDWSALVPYGRPEVKEVGQVREVPIDLVPGNIRKDAEDVVDGKYYCYSTGPDGKAQYQQVTTDWLRPPKVTCSIGYLSPRAFDLTTSQKIDLGWKAVKLVTVGPWELIGDYAQDRIVEELGILFKDRGDATYYIYASAAAVGTADNWGFDKSWLLEFKPEFKRAKFTKVLLCHVLQMYEGEDMKRLFSGRPPTFEMLQKNAGDPRTYDNSAMPHVIFRSDVQGFEKVKEDEYPRAWAIVRFYQLAPATLLGGPDNYNLYERPLEPLRRKPDYLKGDVFALTRTWKALPYDEKEMIGFRRLLTDFSPKAQGLVMTVPEDLREAWDKALGQDEAVVAVIRYATSGKPVPRSARPVNGLKVLWWLHTNPQYQEGKPAWPYCHPDRLRTKYVVEFLKCRSKDGAYNWENPVGKLGSNEVLFWTKKSEPSGTLKTTQTGTHDLEQVVKLEPPEPLKQPGLPFKVCHIRVRLFAHIKTKTTYSKQVQEEDENVVVIGRGPRKPPEDWEGSKTGLLTFELAAAGTFKGNTFEGELKHSSGREKFKQTVTGSIKVTLGGPARDVRGDEIPTKLLGFTASKNTKSVSLDTVEEGGPYTVDETMIVSGGGIPLSEQSTLLTTEVPRLDQLLKSPLLQMRYQWVSIAYQLGGKEASGKAKIALGKQRKNDKWSETQTLEKTEPSEQDMVNIWFTFD